MLTPAPPSPPEAVSYVAPVSSAGVFVCAGAGRSWGGGFVGRGGLRGFAAFDTAVVEATSAAVGVAMVLLVMSVLL